MFNIIVSFLAFILAIGILVAFHEFGHFWVARRLGVKVLRFSIGFGPLIWSRRAKDGVEYCICAIPLGGYVRMLGEKDDDILEADLPFALSKQTVSKRIAIVAAGPLFNFLLAWFFIFILAIVGMRGVAPVIGEVTPGTTAAKAGLHAHDEILSVEGVVTPTVQSVVREIIKYIDSHQMNMVVTHQGVERSVTIMMPAMSAESDKDKDIARRLGFEMAVPARIGEVTPDSPAEQAGIQSGDIITAISGEPIKDWSGMVDKVSANPGKDLTLTLLRHHKLIDKTLIPGEKADGYGYIGVYLDSQLIRQSQLGLKDAVVFASSQTWNYSLLTLKMMYYVVTGRASLDNISGPVTIAQVAGASIQIGVTYFLDFLAIMSISLGVINLLPIPLLDGGHLLYYIIEGIRGKPVSELMQDVGFRIGLLILVSLMFLAFYNDFVRLSVS